MLMFDVLGINLPNKHFLGDLQGLGVDDVLKTLQAGKEHPMGTVQGFQIRSSCLEAWHPISWLFQFLGWYGEKHGPRRYL